MYIMYYQAVSGCVTNMVRVLCRLKIEEPQRNETKINKVSISRFLPSPSFSHSVPKIQWFIIFGIPLARWIRFSPSLRRHRDTRIHQGSQAVWCNRKPGSATTARRASCRSAEPWSPTKAILSRNEWRKVDSVKHIVDFVQWIYEAKWSEINIQNDPISRSQGGMCTSFLPIAWKKN